MVWPGSHADGTFTALTTDPAFVASGLKGEHYCEVAAKTDRVEAAKLAGALVAILTIILSCHY